MNKMEAIKLANAMANEAEAEGVKLVYSIQQAANSDVWAVLEADATWSTCYRTPVQIWVSPDLSFPLRAID